MVLKIFKDLSCSCFLFFVETRNSLCLFNAGIIIVTYYTFIRNALLMRAY